MADRRELERRPASQPRQMEEDYRVPAVDIYETEDSLVLLADMPGVTDKGIEVSVEEDALAIVGRPDAINLKEMSPLYAEFDPLPFRRVFTLSDDIRRDGIAGKMTDGVLRLTLPKADEAKVRKIPIKAQ